MKKTLRGTAGATLVAVSLLAATLPAGASFTIDKIMKNDLNVKVLPASTLNMGGSSFDAPIVQAAESQWNTVTSKAPFASYNTSKSGVGRANAISGSYNIGFSDFPLNIAGPDVGPGSSDTSETTANYVQVPVALGGVAIIFHFGTGISGTTGALMKKYPITVNGLTLAKIFAGKITFWDDAAIAVMSRTSGSGTTFIFQDYLNRVDKADFPAASSASFTHAASTFANSGLLDSGVHSTLGAIGYVEYGYALANNSLTMSLVNKSAKTVALTGTGVLAAATAGLLYIKAHGGFSTAAINNFSINNQIGATVYPIAGFSYAIVKKNQADKNTAIAVVKFLDFLSHQGGGTTNANTFGQDLADNNGYVPLPASLQGIARTLITGVKFAGKSVLSATN
jgi:phosphate transport system substrate-binding protein